MILAALAQDATQLEEALMKVDKNAVCGNEWARVASTPEFLKMRFKGKQTLVFKVNVEQTG